MLPRLSPGLRVPLDDVRDGKAWVAYEFGDEPLDPEHGGPARLLASPATSPWASSTTSIDADVGHSPGGTYPVETRPPSNPQARIGVSQPDNESWKHFVEQGGGERLGSPA